MPTAERAGEAQPAHGVCGKHAAHGAASAATRLESASRRSRHVRASRACRVEARRCRPPPALALHSSECYRLVCNLLSSIYCDFVASTAIAAFNIAVSCPLPRKTSQSYTFIHPPHTTSQSDPVPFLQLERQAHLAEILEPVQTKRLDLRLGVAAQVEIESKR